MLKKDWISLVNSRFPCDIETSKVRCLRSLSHLTCCKGAPKPNPTPAPPWPFLKEPIPALPFVKQTRIPVVQINQSPVLISETDGFLGSPKFETHSLRYHTERIFHSSCYFTIIHFLDLFLYSRAELFFDLV